MQLLQEKQLPLQGIQRGERDIGLLRRHQLHSCPYTIYYPAQTQNSKEGLQIRVLTRQTVLVRLWKID